MQRRELYAIERVFMGFSQLRDNPSWSWFTSDVLDEVSPKVKKLNDINIPVDGYDVYDKARFEIVKKYGEKNEAGELVPVDNMIAIKKEKVADFNKEVETLDAQNKDLLDKENARKADFEKFLDEEIQNLNIKITKAEVHKALNGAEISLLKKWNMVG